MFMGHLLSNSLNPTPLQQILTNYTVRKKIKRFLMCEQGGREMIVQYYLNRRGEKTGVEYSNPPPKSY
jgi:hypothetical protein